MDSKTIEKGKSIAIISYILLVGVLIAWSMNSDKRNEFAAFHIRQAFGLTVTFIGLGLIISNFGNPMITISMWIFVSVLWSYGFLGAIQGKCLSIPLLGGVFQKLFSSKK